jgi:hypothetical protein
MNLEVKYPILMRIVNYVSPLATENLFGGCFGDAGGGGGK